MVTQEQKEIVLNNIKNLSVKEVALLAGLNPPQVRWIMHTNGITKGTNRGRPGTNKYITVPKEFFNVNERECWLSGLD